MKSETREKPNGWDIKVIKTLLSYLYGYTFEEDSLRSRVMVSRSRKTGRLKEIYLDNVLFATIRLSDGFLVPTLHGWELLVSQGKKYFVEVPEDVAMFIAEGKTVFSKHVTGVYEETLPGDEVVITSKSNSGIKVYGSGKAVLPASSMGKIKRGKAVKTRHGKKQ